MRWRSVGAVVAGIAANFLAVPVDLALHGLGVYPPAGQDMSDGLFALAFAYRLALAVLGGFVTARLAPTAPLRHAWILGGIGVVLSASGAAANWQLGHTWYPLGLVLISLPATWAGALLQLRS